VNKIKLSSEEKILEIVKPKECIVLETLSMDITENVNHNKQVIIILFKEVILQ